MNPPSGLSLKTKTTLVIGLVLAALLGGMLYLLSTELTVGLAEFQSMTARQQLQRIVFSLDRTAEKMVGDTAENALWDDTYEFLRGENPDYLQDNFYAVPDVVPDFDVILVWNADNDLVDSAVVSPEELQNGLPMGTTAAEFSPTTALDPATNRASGFIRTSRGPMLFASVGVRFTDGSGDSIGTLTYANFLTGRLLDQAERISGVVALEIAPDGESFDSQSAELISVTNTLPTPVVSFSPNATLWSTGVTPVGTLAFPVTGGDGDLAVIRADLSNELFDLAESSLLGMILYPLAGGVILTLTVIVLVDRLVLRRISELTSEMHRIAESGDSARQIAISGRDEFAVLAHSANRMVRSLQLKSQALLRERALVASILQSTTECVIAVQVDPHPTTRAQSFIVIRSNAAAATFLATSSEELHQHYLELYFPEIQQAHVHQALVDAADSKTTFSKELAGSGNRAGQWFQLSASPWEEGLVITVHDTTERRHSEADLRESLSEIERFNYAMMGREERVMELKQEVTALQRELGRAATYRADA